ncbi:MAG: M48 family metallopeptidase [Deltaproteobacteria bacterium]|nr:M48 family metallopeptidase [Deltaproteobacteria bacterium]
MATRTFQGTLFDVDSKDGVPASVDILPGVLRVGPRGRPGLDVSVRGARLDRGGFDGNQLVVRSDAGQGREVLLYVHEARAAARALLDSGVDRGTEAALRTIAGRTRRGLLIGAVLAGAALAGWGLYLLVSVLGVKVVDLAVAHVPPDLEEQLGRQAAVQVLSEGRVCAAPAMNQALTVLGDRLAAATGQETYTFRLYVMDSPDVNAFALPGGYLFMNRGLLEKADRPEEVAGVLAHEMAHVLRRHGLRNVVARAGVWLLAGLVFGDVAGGGGVLAGGASELLNLSFSRTQEEEADRLGLELLYDAGLDPEGLPDFFRELLEKEAELGAALPSFLSSHPETEERIRVLQGEIQRRGEPAGGAPLTLDWKAAVATCDPVASSDPERTARELGAASPGAPQD